MMSLGAIVGYRPEPQGMQVHMSVALLDQVPLWCFFLLATILSMLAVELGYRLGKWRHASEQIEQGTPVASMVAAILGLLAFMLAFTFSLAAERFNTRREAVLEEANAIGTTYLRSKLLPEPQRSAIGRLLEDYTELRVKPMDQEGITELLRRSDELHQQFWAQATTVAEIDPHSIVFGLFLQSLNETIDLHAKRVFVGLRSRVPLTVWLTLWGLTLIGMNSVGYQSGLLGTRRSPEMSVLALSFALVLLLIVDLDRGHEGFLTVSQQSMVDVWKMMQASSS